jgi:hypothetical protein
MGTTWGQLARTGEYLGTTLVDKAVSTYNLAPANRPETARGAGTNGKESSVITRTQLLITAALLMVSGCGYGRPLLQPPGPMYRQQQNASLHDPYPDNDLGPTVDGGRPRDFQKPLAEPVRNRRVPDSWWGWGRR